MSVKAVIVSIGDELLIGDTLNTNAYWMSRVLSDNGINVVKHYTIGDSFNEIFETISREIEQVEIVLVTGGLGPTEDDLTKEVLLKIFDGELLPNEKVLNNIEQIFSKKGRELNELNKEQALVPSSSEVVFNEFGTAPGLWFSTRKGCLVAMPGVPFEMKKMMTDRLIPRFVEEFKCEEVSHEYIYVFDIPESRLADEIADWAGALPKSISLAYLPSFYLVRLRLSGVDKTAIEKAKVAFVGRIPEESYSFSIDTYSQYVAHLLLEKKYSLATAESCTGGNIGHLITLDSGSSQYFKGGVIAYSNEIKENVLGVKLTTLTEYGAVNEEVVKEMVLGVKQKFEVDCAVAVSGVAGPTGGTKEKPVGYVWLAVAVKDKVKTFELNWGNMSRKQIIEFTSLEALRRLRKELLKTQNK